MTGLNTKANDCKASMGWHGLCLSKGARGNKMDKIHVYCIPCQIPFDKSPISSQKEYLQAIRFALDIGCDLLIFDLTEQN